MAFVYQRRSAADLQKRADQSGYGDSVGFIKPEHKLWSPKKGENWIRILPPTWDDARHYALDVFAHYSIGPSKASIVCLSKQTQKKCPICEEASRLEEQHGRDHKSVRDLRVSKRCCMWVIDRKEPDRGPMVWTAPYTCDRDIVKISSDRQTNETYFIDDPVEGYDVSFDRVGEGLNTEYTGFQIGRRPTSAPQEAVEHVVKFPLPKQIVFRSYAEVKALFEGDETGGHTDAPVRDNPSRHDTRDEPEQRVSKRMMDDPRPEPPPAEEAPQMESRRRAPPPREESPREQTAPSSAPLKPVSRADALRARFKKD